MGSLIAGEILGALEHFDLAGPIRKICARQRRDKNWGVILLGKNAADMAEGITFPRFKGMMIAPAEALPRRSGGPWTILAGDHPIPGKNSFIAGERLQSFVQDRAHDAFFVGLSGGGSALAEDPWFLFSRAEVRQAAEDLLASPLSIRRINAVRKRLSSIKGGRLASLMGKRPAVTVALSDVSDGEISSVASGPTVPDDTGDADVLRALSRLPDSPWRRHLKTLLKERVPPRTPRRGDAVFRNKRHVILGDNSTLLTELRRRVRPHFKQARLLCRNADEPLRSFFPKLWKAAQAMKPGEAVLFGGEFTFPLPAMHGAGGRVSHLGALLLERLLRSGRQAEFGALGLATDGVDGASPCAGFLFEAPKARLEKVCDAVGRFDTGAFLEGAGMGIRRPKRGLNLRDVFILWRES